MPKVDLKLYSTAAIAGTKQTTTVQYVNPDASNDVLKEFAQKLNSFTTNTYSESDRVETVNLDTDNSRKQRRNITITNATRGATNARAVYTITAGTTFTPLVFFENNNTVTKIEPTFQPGDIPTQGQAVFTIPNSAGTLYVGFQEGTKYYSELKTATVE